LQEKKMTTTKPVAWRAALTLLVLLASLGAYAWRGFQNAARSGLPPTLSGILQNGLKLGLDLKGGLHLVLQVKTSDALRAEVLDATERLRDEGRRRGLAIDVVPVNDTGFTVPRNDTSLRDVLAAALPPTDWKIEEAGADWRVSLRESSRLDLEQRAVRQAVETLRNRVDALGVAEPFVATQGADRVLVELPGVDDPARVKEILGTTGLLELRLVDDRGGPFPSEAEARSAYAGQVPLDLELLAGFEEGASERTPVTYAVRRAPAVTGHDLKNARVTPDRTGAPAVEFFLTATGADRFAKLTGENVGKRLAIVLDGRVVSAASIHETIRERGIIQGRFTEEKADALALVLRSGALPARMTILEERTVGPSLGLDSIRQGVAAAVVGMVLVFVGVLVTYRLAGLNAVLALIMNALILLGAMAWNGFTLTLPGIAGFILTIGMAVDSNVLIFERIREEIDDGKLPGAAVDLGFKRAFGTIVDTHVTTIFAAALLFAFGSGPVKGFAVTLVLGLAASVFTAVFVSRLLFDVSYRNGARQRSLSI